MNAVTLRHDTCRKLILQAHTHGLIANMAVGPEGKQRTVDIIDSP